MEEKLLWNTPIIKIPDEFVVFTKNNKIKVVKSLTKNNNLKTIKKKKPIKIIEDKNIDNIIIENKGRKVEIDNKDFGLKKMLKEKKPKIKKDIIDQKLIETKNIKKPTIKISEPIITKKEEYKEDEKEDEEYKKKVINNFNKGLKAYRENLRHFYRNPKFGEQYDDKKKQDFIDFNDLYFKKYSVGEFLNKDAKIIKDYAKSIGINPRLGLRFTSYKKSNFKEEYDKLKDEFLRYNQYLQHLIKGYDERLKNSKTKKIKKSKDHLEYENKINNLKKDIINLIDENKDDLFIKDLKKNDSFLKNIY